MKEKQSIIKFLILAVILAVALTAGFATGAMKTAALTADWTLSLRAILRLAAMAAGVLLAEVGGGVLLDPLQAQDPPGPVHPLHHP